MSNVNITNNIPTFISKFKDGIIKANNEVGEFVKKNMDNNTPVRTGNLKAHNKYSVNENEVVFENDCEYAGYQEFGSKNENGKSFFRPAAEQHRTEITNIYERNLPK